MLESMFDLSSLSTGSAAMTSGQVIVCTAASLVLGVCAALIFMFKNNSSRSFSVTVALLPVMVQSVIMLVNGNLGTGVAVLGAFSLVRFRSAPGSAREIAGIFFAMSLGLATGMGYVLFALILFAAVGAVYVLLTAIGFGDRSKSLKELRVTIPESLDYSEIFDDLFAEYAKKYELIKVKTSNMGSLFELRYSVTFKDGINEKEFIDRLRCRNGNLNISLGRSIDGQNEL